MTCQAFSAAGCEARRFVSILSEQRYKLNLVVRSVRKALSCKAWSFAQTHYAVALFGRIEHKKHLKTKKKNKFFFGIERVFI